MYSNSYLRWNSVQTHRVFLATCLTQPHNTNSHHHPHSRNTTLHSSFHFHKPPDSRIHLDRTCHWWSWLRTPMHKMSWPMIYLCSRRGRTSLRYRRKVLGRYKSQRRRSRQSEIGRARRWDSGGRENTLPKVGFGCRLASSMLRWT